MYDPIGKIVSELANELEPVYFNGYCIFVLKNDEDEIGTLLDESYSIKEILRSHPEIANYKVKFENDFFGMTVLRVLESYP